jgi:hypothetical protein
MGWVVRVLFSTRILGRCFRGYVGGMGSELLLVVVAGGGCG